ncbi:MAG TPA: DUF885 domain-containing protein [Terriglobales bacterium]|nr:DUF885 domain-containing protein [Terriglobales bacterium]
MRPCCRIVLLILLALTTISAAQTQPPAKASPAASAKDWIKRSNENAQILLKVQAKFAPEFAARQGVEGLDDQVTQFPPNRREQVKGDTRAAITQLEKILATEKDPLVRQDLEIMIQAAQRFVRGQEITEKYDMPYFNLPQLLFSGIRALLDDQVPENRRTAALVRLRKYAGMEPGYQPLTEQAKARTAEWTKPGQLPPAKVEVETNLARADFFINGIEQLFQKYKIEGYQEPYAKLKQQLADYNAWVKQEILPKARTDFRLPAEEYAFGLQQIGVDIPPEQLAAMAHKSFTEYQQAMQEVAAKIAKRRGLKSTDYRDVIRELKKDQLVGEAILPKYKETLASIEGTIRKEKLATLPNRPARIRLATPAETAQQPAPHMDPPPFLNNTGQQGEFVLPLNVPAAPGSAQTKQIDDFTFAASTWTLTAHEARPGHEMQFDSMVERGVSIARALYAFNSTNVEGWGLYAEYITQPYMPLDGQLISLQLRLMRAARAFLDPELQSGKVTPADAMRVLTQDVVLSDAFANTEVERYTFRAPGQATSYYYGFTKLLELRKDVEANTGKNFSAMKFHDFILSQGLLPPELLRKAVMQQFAATH